MGPYCTRCKWYTINIHRPWLTWLKHLKKQVSLWPRVNQQNNVENSMVSRHPGMLRKEGRDLRGCRVPRPKISVSRKNRPQTTHSNDGYIMGIWWETMKIGSKSTFKAGLTMWDSPDTNCCVELGDLPQANCGNQPDQRQIEVQITIQSQLNHHKLF